MLSKMLLNFQYKAQYRRMVQIGSLVLNNSYFFKNLKWCPTPVLNCYACPLSIGACPIGTLQHFAVLGQIPFFLIGFFLVIGGAIGRMVCGWACPIGWLQEMLHKVPVPKWQIRWKSLRYLKYVVLVVLVLWIPFITKEPWFSKLCFVGTLEAGIPLSIFDEGIRSMIGTLFYIKLVILVVLMGLFLFVKRPFCRFLCPLGAIWSPFNKVSFLRLHVDEGCNQCNACQTICPVDIKVYEEPNSAECVRCLACTTCEHVSLCAGKMGTKEKGVEAICVNTRSS